MYFFFLGGVCDCVFGGVGVRNVKAAQLLSGIKIFYVAIHTYLELDFLYKNV